MKAVVFDLDGTLLDTLGDIAGAANRALEQMGLPTHPADAYRNFVGDGLEVMTRRALPQPVDEDLATLCIPLVREGYASGWDRETKPYEGIIDMLDNLRERGIILSVLSNKPHPFTVKCVTRFLGMDRFHGVWGVSPGTPRKPDTTGLERILAGLPAAREDVLYVGDTNTDMQTAGAAGLFAVGVSWGFRPRTELEANGADRIIDHPRELLNLL